MKIVCLGPEGSFTSLMANKIFPNKEIVYMHTYEGCQNLKKKNFAYAIYPLENNTGGFVYDTLRSIYQTAKISIIGLETLEIQQNLISHCKDIRDIEAIHTHPQAIAQCQKKIQELEKERGKKIKIVKLGSTSEGIIEASANHRIAGIGSKEASELYNVPILKKKFQDKSRNETRFVILQIGSPKKINDNYKTMFLIEVKNKSGALIQLLNLIHGLSINITSLTSHPVYREKGAWEYAFFLEVEGHVSSEPLKILHKVLSGKRLNGQSRRGRWLGSYKNNEKIAV